MSKKRKTPAKNTLTTRKTTAPMIVRAPTQEATAVTAPVVVETPASVSVAPEVTLDREVVARLAFSKFVGRGCVHGYALEDWLAAEAELRAELLPPVAKA